MGKRSRERRAAKKRARRGRGPHGPGCSCDHGFDEPPFLPPPEESLAEALRSAAHAHVRGDRTAAAACASVVTGEDFAPDRRTVYTAATMALATTTRGLWRAGWSPDSPYVDAKSHLVAAIAGVNRCKSVFHPKLGFVSLVGEEVDLEITELLTTSLLVQATRAMVAEGTHVTRTGTSRTRSFRQSFLVSYAVRIGERLTEATDRAHDPTTDDKLLPVLARRSRAVEETFKVMFSHTVQKSVSVSNGSGWHAGRQAADRANLTIERQTINA